MVLSDRSIKEEIEAGRIIIKPFDPKCIQPASVDIHLGRKFLVFRHWAFPHFIDLSKPLDGLVEAKELREDEHFSIQPGTFVLGTTLEFIRLPADLMARLEGKSSLGRVGLLIHSTAGYVDPGWEGHLTLELYNICSMPIHLRPGMKISQISFHRLTTPAERPYGTPSLRSKYKGQIDPTPTRYFQEFDQPTLVSLSTLQSKLKVRQKASMQDKDSLRKWLKSSHYGGSVKKFSEALGVSLKTVEDWVYRGRQPSEANRKRLFEIMGLPQFKPEEKPQLELQK